MKLQHLSVIFVVIIVPITMILSFYIGSLIDVSNMESQYDSLLMNSAYDAVRAYQMNTLQNRFNSQTTSKERDLKATINAFFNSLSSGLSLDGYRKEELNEYIPALLFTMYDGFYTYGPYNNIASVSEGRPVFNSNGNLYDVDTTYGLKPFEYYSCEYALAGQYDIIVNYTLDNYITVMGTYDGNTKYISSSGYYINPSTVYLSSDPDNMDVVLYKDIAGQEITITPEVLGEYITATDSAISISVRRKPAYPDDSVFEDITDLDFVQEQYDYAKAHGSLFRFGSDITKLAVEPANFYELTSFRANGYDYQVKAQYDTNKANSGEPKYYNYVIYNDEKYYYDDEHKDEVKQTQVIATTEYVMNFNYSYDNIPIFKIGRDSLRTYINQDQLNDLTRYLYDEDVVNSDHTEQIRNKNHFLDVNAYYFYKMAQSFSQKAYEALANINVQEPNIIKSDSYNANYTVRTNSSDVATGIHSHVKTTYDTGNVFDYMKTGNNPELESSSFDEHRIDVIISSIEYSLVHSIANFNRYIYSTYDYEMPALTEEDWYKIANNISIVGFMQGLPMKNYKYYSSYAIVNSTMNKDYVAKNAIYVERQNIDHSIDAYKASAFTYHNPRCKEYNEEVNDLSATDPNGYSVIGYRNVDYMQQSYYYGDENELVLYYPQPGQGAYECIIENSDNNLSTDEIISGKYEINNVPEEQKPMSQLVRKAYITALARERQALYSSRTDVENSAGQVNFDGTKSFRGSGVTTGISVNINSDTITFTTDLEWTNSPEVIRAVSSNGNEVQLSLDKVNWEDDSITVSHNGKVYARIIDYTGTPTSNYAIINVGNIDEVLPTTTKPMCTATTNSITVHSAQNDALSGISRIRYYIRKATETDWHDAGRDFQPGEGFTFEGLDQNTEYYVISTSWDRAGNYSTSEVTSIVTVEVTSLAFGDDVYQINSDPKNPTGEITELLANGKINFSPVGWTNQDVTVTADINAQGYTLYMGQGDTEEEAIANIQEVNSVKVTYNKYIVATLIDSDNQMGGIAKFQVTSIDKLKPTCSTPEITADIYRVNVHVDCDDADGNGKNSKSGIAKIEYSICDKDQLNWTEYKESQIEYSASAYPTIVKGGNTVLVRVRITDKAGNITEKTNDVGVLVPEAS